MCPALGAWYTHIFKLIDDRLAGPRNDLISFMVHNTARGTKLGRDDVANLAMSLVSAGWHAAVGAAWALARILGHHPTTLHITGSDDVPTWTDADRTWVRAPLAITPPWWHERLPDPTHVDELTGPPSPAQDMTQLWAWVDEPAGTVRMRTFAARVGIDEDEACGSGAMRLAAALGRRLTIHHGRGSLIHARPGPPGHADIGGHVTEDEPRALRRLSG